jgi:TRAP-type C4-dicarboxylate transport system substrate-binding protein
MKVLLSVFLILSMVATVILSGCAGSTPSPTSAPVSTPSPQSSPAPKQQEIKFLYHSFVSSGSKQHDNIYWIMEQVSKKTGVTITLDKNFSEAIVKGPEQLSALDKGVIELAWITPSYTPADLPLWTLTNSLPLMSDDSGAVANLLMDYYNNFEPARKELDKFKVKFICGGATDPALLAGNKRVQSIADMKGYRARTLGLVAKAWGALGGVPVSLTAAETYEGIQKGTVDGTIAYLINQIVGAKYYEVSKYVTYPGFGAFGVAFLMSKQKWDTLPKNVQDEILIVAKDVPQFNYDLVAAEQGKALEIVKKAGITIDTLPNADVEKMKQLTREPVWNAEAKSLNDKGLPGTDAINFIMKSVAEYEKTHPRK